MPVYPGAPTGPSDFPHPFIPGLPPRRSLGVPRADHTDGRLRPLGIAALEDKILQRAVVEVLNAIYEADFRGFSYGFRPGRGPHGLLAPPRPLRS